MSIVAAPSATFEAVCTGFATGLTGTLGVRLLDNAGATTTARVTAGIAEYPSGSGIYYVQMTAPSTAGQYTVMWDTGTVSPSTVATEDLLVTAAAAATIAASSGDYTTSTLVKDALGITVSTYDTRLARDITAASRAIDGICDRRFYADADATSVRHYTPRGNVVAVDDLVTVTSVKTDTSGDYTYATTLTVNTDYLLEPFNAADDGRPYTSLVGNPRTGYWFSEYPRWVQVTGQFGWSSVPSAIAEATIIVATKLFKRPEAPFGIITAGVDQVTAMRIAMSDPDVRMLVEPFRRLLV